MKSLFICLLLLLVVQGNAQSKCLSDTTLSTCRVGTFEEDFSYNAQFELKRDSVTMRTQGPESTKLVFIIINKSDCSWNNDFTEGKAVYEVVLTDTKKKATLRIFRTTALHAIEILYEGSKESRVFKMCK